VAHPSPLQPGLLLPRTRLRSLHLCRRLAAGPEPGAGAANFQSGDLPLPAEWGGSRAGAGGAAALLSPARQVLPQPPPQGVVRAGGGDHRRQRALRAGRPAALSAQGAAAGCPSDRRGERGPSPPAATLRPVAARVVRQPAAGGDRRRDGQAGGAAASLDGGQTGGGDRHRPGPGAASGLDRHPEGTSAGGQTRQLQRQGSAAGLDPAPLPLIEQRPGDTLLFDAKQSLRLPRLAADEARPRLAALVASGPRG
jgi:hypothetical protein